MKRISRPDLAAALMLALAAGVWTWVGFASLRPAILDRSTFNYWFEGDAPHTYMQMSGTSGKYHGRSSRHPLFSLVSGVPVSKARHLTGLDRETAVLVWMVAVSALWALLFFAVLRRVGLQTGSAVVFGSLGIVSAATVFSLPMPGHYVLGSATMLAAPLVVAAHREDDWRAPTWLLVCVAAGTLAITTTNWAAGLALLLVAAGFRRGALLAAISLLTVLALFALQKYLVPDAAGFLLPSGESGFVLHALGGGSPPRLSVIFLGSIVMPPIQETVAPVWLSIQRAIPGSGSVLNAVATLLWLALLVATFRWWRVWSKRPIGQVIALILASQVLLQLVFGFETFLYAIHWAPMLIALVALGAVAGSIRVFTIVGAALTVLLAINNFAAFAEARALAIQRYDDHTAFVGAVREAMDTSAPIVHGSSRDDRLERRSTSIPDSDDLRIFWRLGPEVDKRDLEMTGWTLYHDLWTLDRIEALKEQGARYFMSTYRHGLDESKPFIDQLALHYHTVARADGYVIIDLTRPATPG